MNGLRGKNNMQILKWFSFIFLFLLELLIIVCYNKFKKKDMSFVNVLFFCLFIIMVYIFLS